MAHQGQELKRILSNIPGMPLQDVVAKLGIHRRTLYQWFDRAEQLPKVFLTIKEKLGIDLLAKYPTLFLTDIDQRYKLSRFATDAAPGEYEALKDENLKLQSEMELLSAKLSVLTALNSDVNDRFARLSDEYAAFREKYFTLADEHSDLVKKYTARLEATA